MVDENAIDAYYECLATFLPGIPRPFIVSADKSDFAEDTDARPELVVVPADHPLEYIDIPTDHHIKRSTLAAAIIADATGLKPLMIVPRFTIELELYFWGYEVTKVIFKYQVHGFITFQLFEEWVNKMPMPSSAEQRELTHYTG
jgi:hypothetical protein